MTTVYLIRHAQAEGNLYRRVHGHYNSLLTPMGKLQAEALNARFAAVPLAAVYASDLIRARLTAEAVAKPHGLAVHTDLRLREQNFGIWEDQCFGALRRSGNAYEALFSQKPGEPAQPEAESIEHSVRRLRAAVTEAAQAHPGQNIAIVTHGTVLHNLTISLFGEAGDFHGDNTSVCCLQYEDGQFRAEYLGDNAHLTPEISTLRTQRWRQTGATVQGNLWFRPYDRDRERYCFYRRDAWQVIYGNTEGLDEQGFYDEICNTMFYHPEAGAYAMMGEEPVGFIQLAPARYRDRGIGYITFVYLCEEVRDLGLGAQLIGYAVSVYRKKGRRALQLAVAPGNYHARHFYEKLGFRQVGTIPGAFTDLLLLQLDIDTAPYLKP